MRKVIFGGANSLDNFIAREDGSYDWIIFGDEVAEIMKDMWSRFDCMVMGRKTYDVATGGGQSSEREGVGERAGKKKSRKASNPYGDIETYVFSRTLKPGKRDGVEFVSTDPGKFVAKLKKKKGKDIMVMGGGEIGAVLLEAGVVDEIGFNIHPVLLGSGVSLFHKMSRSIDLELTECKRMKNGCVYVRYNVKK
jgi:dihydrofolate reductase